NSAQHRLKSCRLSHCGSKDGLFLGEPLPSSYQPHYSLAYLKVHVRNLATLKYLLMFLPKLTALDVDVGTRVRKEDQELFPTSFNPCCNLTKLVMK
ncbi:unnamed protein product, partial [Adineta ricciae]